MAIANEGGRPAIGERGRFRAVLGRLDDPAVLLLIAASLVSAGLILYFERTITFRLDEWEFLIDRGGWSADAIFSPHNEHIVVGPILVYKLLIELFGTASPRPFQVGATATFVASVVLMFAWLRPRTGAWPALAASVLVLFMGAAAEDLLWPFQIGYFGSMVGGIAMLLALQRGDRLGEVIAPVSLLVGLAFSSVGLAFVPAGVVLIALGPRRGSRAIAIAIPFLLYVAWWVHWGRHADNAVSLHNLANSPRYLADGLASTLASIFGLAEPHDWSPLSPLDLGRVLLGVAIVLAAMRIRRLGRVPATVWVPVAALLAFWVLAALNTTADRPATSSRYQYVGAVLLILVAGELCAGIRLRRPGLIAAFAVTALALVGSVTYFHTLAVGAEATGQVIRADLAAYEIARDRVDPGFIAEPSVAGTGDVYIPAGAYLALADAHGSPAFDLDELEQAPEYARAAADRVLAAALDLRIEQASSSGAECEHDALSPTEPATVALDPGEITLRAAPGARVALGLGRFADGFPVDAGILAGGEARSIAIPADRASAPWRVQLVGHGRVEVCHPR